MNEIVFPAAILKPPFFNPKADDAVNYGGIGAVYRSRNQSWFRRIREAKRHGDGNLLSAPGLVHSRRRPRQVQGKDPYLVGTVYQPMSRTRLCNVERFRINELHLGENRLPITLGRWRSPTRLQAILPLGGRKEAAGDRRFVPRPSVVYDGWAQVWRGRDADTTNSSSIVKPILTRRWPSAARCRR